MKYDNMNQMQQNSGNGSNPAGYQVANNQSNPGINNPANLFVGQGLINNGLQ